MKADDPITPMEKHKFKLFYWPMQQSHVLMCVTSFAFQIKCSLESFVILVAFRSITMILPDLKYLHTLKQTSGRLQVCFVGLCALSGNHPFCTYVGKGEQEVKVMYSFKYRSKDLFLMCICMYIFF